MFRDRDTCVCSKEHGPRVGGPTGHRTLIL